MARESDEHNDMTKTHDIIESLEDSQDVIDYEFEDEDEQDVFETMGNERFDGEENNEDNV
jgi:hypothetical protein